MLTATLGLWIEGAFLTWEGSTETQLGSQHFDMVVTSRAAQLSKLDWSLETSLDPKGFMNIPRLLGAV